MINLWKRWRYTNYRFREALRRAETDGPVFAQDGEDAIAHKLLGKIESFIDIGANDGLTFSNTFYCAYNGARGIAFEPVGCTYKMLKQVHRRFRNVVCIRGAVGAETEMRWIAVDGHAGLLSSLVESAKFVTEAKPRFESVHVRPLMEWLRPYSEFREVDLVSIDVEGFEWEVVKGIDFEKFGARLVIIENDDPDKEQRVRVERIFEGAGYRLILSTSLNAFFSRDHRLLDDATKSEIRRFCPTVAFPVC